MKVLKKILKYLLFIILLPIVLLLGIFAWYYASCPIYKFDEPKPFSGNTFYNPYENTGENLWKKSVFHLHTKSWGGITDGYNNDYQSVIDVYKGLKYDVVNISNYMKVDETGIKKEEYIPSYEHGYNIRKTHHLGLGSKGKILWRDYLFPQSLSEKQHTIDLLKERCSYVAVNHPALRDGFWPKDFKYISGYDFFEVQNGAVLSDIHWDTALSNGHRAWVIANDDNHDVSKLDRVQREATFVYSASSNGDSILANMDKGKAFGVRFPRKEGAWTFEEKIKEAEKVTYPEKIQFQNDTLTLVWKEKMDSILFIGDHGVVLERITDTNAGFYVVRPQDTYVRIKLSAPTGLDYYLNPILRSNGEMPAKQYLASIAEGKTWAKRIIIGVSLVVLAALIISLRRKKKHKRNI